MRTQRRTANQKAFTAMVVLLAILVGAAAIWGRRAESKKTIADTIVVTYPYRTIETTNGKLLAYVLHLEQVDADGCPTYTAVINEIDPAKDDYKTYCKAVITDIVKTTDTQSMQVNVYDDDKACALYEGAYARADKFLSKEEEDLVSRHTVATYSGIDHGEYEDRNMVCFYQDVQNGYSEKEIFIPKL